MGRSRLGWAGSVAAPWCIALFMLLSITAEAGQEPAQNASAVDPVRAAIAFAPAPGLRYAAGQSGGLPLGGAPNPSTPARSDGLLVVGEAHAGKTTVAQMSDAGGKPTYAILVDPKESVRQMRCLAEAIYFESRG